jgi:hypothetical protein
MRATPHVLDPESVRERRRSRRAGSSTHPAWQDEKLAPILHLHVDRGTAAASDVAAASGDLWAAWQSLDDWEATADDELGARLGEVLLVLWTIHRLGSSPEGQAAIDSLIDANLHPTFEDPFLEDVVGVSFALGAAWANWRNTHSNPGGVI